MRLTTDQVKKVIRLANLPVSRKEEEKYSSQLSKILDYIDLLNSVNTKGVGPTYNVTGLSSVMGSDNAVGSLDQKDVLGNAPQEKNGYLITKGVFESE